MARPSAFDLPDDEKVSPSDEKGCDRDERDTNLNERDTSGEPLSASWRSQPLSAVEADKVMQILRACKDNDRQLLSTLAVTPGGFVEDHFRRLACMYCFCPW